MLSTEGRERIAKAGFVAVLAVLFSSMALGQYGGLDSYLNAYFLPADAQISGMSGLIFGVLAPLGIIVVLLNIGLERAMGKRRETKALAILIALFIIPSGGYKTISNVLIGFFSIGQTAGTGITGGPLLPAAGPLSGYDFAGIAAFITFLGLVYFLGGQDGDVDLSDLATSAIGAAMIFFILQGGFSIFSLASSLVVVGIGWYIFDTGLEARQFSGYLVALLGFFLMVWGLRSIQGLPAPVESLLGTASMVGLIVLVVILVVAVVIAALVLKMNIIP